MIDISLEEVFPLSDAPKRCNIRRRGKPLNVATFYRWAANGSRGVRLETVRVGGSLYTSLEAIRRFSERLTDPDADPRPPVRDDDDARIDAELAEVGI